MEKLLLPLIAVIAGAALAIQGQINGELGKKVGVIEASFISFSIGSIALFLIVLFFGKGDLLAAITVPKWQLNGAFLGAIYVITTILVIPKLGVVGTFMAIITGQIVLGAVIDHFGLFNGHQIPIDV
ncbi:transporter family-2 protein [Neobacillus niacini]|uniref:DMT family transporter n=1 Tax=Neobacillus niacini TaxID=86668 RepID=UPI00277FC595|nr:DMT family transporter [Neobacillus niacini]MDQ1002867.1 transporter family-2 protein [Neobacillus niacini]